MLVTLRKSSSEMESAQLRLWSLAVLARAKTIAGRSFVRVDWRRSLENALAARGEPYLRLGLPWLTKMSRRHGRTAIAFILCHEIAHTVDFTARASNFTRELFADEVAGMLLAALGFKPAGAIRFLVFEADCTECTTHPPADARIAALKQGYGDMLLHLALS